MTYWSYLWITLILIGVALEIVALFNAAAGDTLSEHVWAAYKHPTWGQFVAWMLTAFLLWLAYHWVRVRFLP